MYTQIGMAAAAVNVKQRLARRLVRDVKLFTQITVGPTTPKTRAPSDRVFYRNGTISDTQLDALIRRVGVTAWLDTAERALNPQHRAVSELFTEVVGDGARF